MTIKEKLDLFFELNSKIREYFDLKGVYDEIEDYRESPWFVRRGEVVYLLDEGPIKEQIEMGNYYSAEFYGTGGVIRKDGLAAVWVYDNGNKFVIIFSEEKEITDKEIIDSLE